VVYRFEHLMNPGRLLLPGIARRGVTYQALCRSCNNELGRRYVGKMKEFVEQAGNALTRDYRPVERAVGISDPEVRTVDFLIDPLGVMKYIATAMLVTCRASWPVHQPALSRFVLDPWAKGLPPAFRFYAALLYGPFGRVTGLQHRIDIHTGQIVHLAEVSFPPLALVMTVDQPASERTWPGEITHLAGGDYRWKERRRIRIEMATCFTTSDSVVPGILPSPARDREMRMDAFREAHEW
jgi:hypothetical protein